jgi:hypothetical protein
MMRPRNRIRRRPAASSMSIAALAAALLVIVCGRAEAITLFGSNFLSPGRQWDPGFSLFGEELSPRLDLDGLVRIQILDQQLHNQTNNLITPQLDLQTNLQLTATQRVYALWRPIEWGAREPTFFQFGNDHGWTGRFSETPQALFYEGQPFNWLSPNDRLPLDFTLAIGRIPLFLHNGLWFNNFMDGFQLSKNNIQLGNLSNLNIMYFLTLGETQPGLNLNLANRREATKRVMGADINGDWRDYFFELSYAASYDNDKLPGLEQNLNRGFWAVSVTRTFGFNSGVSLRAMGSTGNGTAGAGELAALETQRGVLGQLAYFNIFGATRNWKTPSVSGSPLSQEGILFTFDRLQATPTLNLRGSGTVGSAIGVVLDPRAPITYTPEFGWLVDTQSPGNDQVGLAFQIQADLAHIFIPGNTLGDMVRRGILYGALARLTFVGVRNENTHLAGDRFDFGSMLELIYQF